MSGTARDFHSAPHGNARGSAFPSVFAGVVFVSIRRVDCDDAISFGCTPDEARAFAKDLKRAAREADRRAALKAERKAERDAEAEQW